MAKPEPFSIDNTRSLPCCKLSNPISPLAVADVDDKIINRANATGEDPLALSQRFINEFHADMVSHWCGHVSHLLSHCMMGGGLQPRSSGSPRWRLSALDSRLKRPLYAWRCWAMSNSQGWRVCDVWIFTKTRACRFVACGSPTAFYLVLICKQGLHTGAT